MIRFHCPGCQCSLKAPVEKAGLAVSCPNCKQRMEIPAPLPIPPQVSLPVAPVISYVPNPVKHPPTSLPRATSVVAALPTVVSVPRTLPPPTPPPSPPKSLVVFHQDGRIRLNIVTPEVAKLAIKELRLKKKEWAVVKREIAEDMRQLRAAYTDYVRRRGSQFRGGKGIGRMIRAFETMNRDQMRRRLADELAPLERERRDIDSRVLEIDHAILEAQRIT